MGVLHSIPLCSRGQQGVAVEPLDLDKNNNSVEAVTSQPINNQPPPEATSTPVRPQSPTGLANDQYSEQSSEAETEEPPALSDSGLEESATEFEFSRPSPDNQSNSF